MAATGLSNVVTSTLELLAGYSYQPSTDPAYAALQHLDVAEAFIAERNKLREDLRKSREELRVERERARVYAGFLQELIGRVGTLPQATELLEGIQRPNQQTMSRALCDLLGDYSQLLNKDSASLQTTRDDVDLTQIKGYLDRCLVKSESSLQLLSRLELSKEPLVFSAWRTVKANLNEKLQRPVSQLEEISLKAKALNALKSVEVSSLEEAWHNADMVKTALEDLLVESEGWVVTEAHHGRVEMTKSLKDHINRRIQLISAPWTVENLNELSEIHREYEYIRKKAALEPWSDHLHVESNWWNLVHLCSQLVSKSEKTLNRLSNEDSSALTKASESLQAQSTVDSEGSFLYLEDMLNLLIKAEDSKMRYMTAKQDYTELSPATEPATAFCHEYITLAMLISELGEEPCQDLLQLNTRISKKRDVMGFFPELAQTVQHLKEVAVVKIQEKTALHWAEKLLVKCAGIYPEGHEKKRQILEEINYIRSHSKETKNSARKERIIGFLSEGFTYLQDNTLRKLQKSEWQSSSSDPHIQPEQLSVLQQRLYTEETASHAQQTQIQSIHSVLETGLQDLNAVFVDLQSSPEHAMRTWAVSAQQETKELTTDVEKISFLVDSVKGIAGQIRLLTPTPKPAPTVLPEQVLLALEEGTNGGIRTVMSLLEAAGKPALLTTGTTLLATHSDPMSPVPAFRAKFDYITSACTEVKTLLSVKSAEPEELTLARKLKDLIDQVHRNTLDLAKGSVSPANEQQVRKSLQSQASALSKESTALRLAELLTEAVVLERQQVDLRVNDDFHQAESCEAALVPKSPVAGGSSPPTNLEKLSSGLRYLLQNTNKLETDWEVVIDETQSKQKLAQIEVNTGYQKLLLQEAYLHWRFSAIKADIDKKLQGLTVATLAVLEKRVKSMQDSPQTADLQAAMEKVKSEQSGKISFSQLNTAIVLLDSAIPKAGFKVSAFQGVLEAVENLKGVCEVELDKHAEKLEFTPEEDIQITQGNSQARASALLAAMERGIQLLSGMIPPQDSVITPLQVKLYQIIQTFSRPEAETLLTASFAGPMQAVFHMIDNLQALSDKIYARLAKSNSPRMLPDICAHIELLISLSNPEQFDTNEAESLSPVRRPLSGFAPRPSPYAPIDKAAGEAIQSAVLAYEAIGLRQLAEAGREQLQIHYSQGDPQAIIAEKLEFLTNSLATLRSDYVRSANQTFDSMLNESKQGLNTAIRLLKSTAESIRVQEDIRQIQQKEGRGELKDSLQLAQSTLTRVVNQLSLDYSAEYQASGPETSQKGALEPGIKLSAMPSSSEKAAKGLEYLRLATDSLVEITETEVSSETFAQISALPTTEGQEKLYLEQSIIYSQLKAVHFTLKTYILELIPALKNSIRLVSNKLVNRVDMEVAIMEIEEETSTVGTIRELTITLEDQIKTSTS